MPRSFNLSAKWKRTSIKDPRVVMRAVIGVLLAANLAAAVIAFKPFGGSADDMRRDRQGLRAQLGQMQARLETSKRLVEKVQTARSEGDQFLGKYVIGKRSAAENILAELTQAAGQAGIKPGNTQWHFEPVEGSDTIEMLTISAGFEGNYANLTKFMNLLDKSPRFLIIENMQANAPQGQGQAAAGQALNVTLKIDTFVRDDTGATS